MEQSGNYLLLHSSWLRFDFVPEIVFIVCNMHVSMAAHTLFIRGQEKMGCAYDSSRGSGFGPAELNIEWTASGVNGMTVGLHINILHSGK